MSDPTDAQIEAALLAFGDCGSAEGRVMMRAALIAAAKAAPAEPVGWKLVPREPTKEMCEAAPSMPAIHAVDDLPLAKAGWSPKAVQNAKRWRAMLAASPPMAEPVSEAMIEAGAEALWAKLKVSELMTLEEATERYPQEEGVSLAFSVRADAKAVLLAANEAARNKTNAQPAVTEAAPDEPSEADERLGRVSAYAQGIIDTCFDKTAADLALSIRDEIAALKAARSAP